MKYKYSIKIHSVEDYLKLEEVMNDYGKYGYRVIKAEFIGDNFENNIPMKKYVLYLEKKLKKWKIHTMLYRYTYQIKNLKRLTF